MARVTLGCTAADPTLARDEALVLSDADDPFEARARVLADELGFTFGVQYAPWMGASWDGWNTFVASHFNSLTNLGALTQISLKNGADAPLYLDELGWAMTDAKNPAYYPVWQPFFTMRGHTTVWYNPAVLPPWLSYMAHLADVGVEAAVTEFDFLVVEGSDQTTALRTEARAAREILDACIDSGNCSTFIGWGAIEDATTYATGAVHPRGLVAHDLTPLAPYRLRAAGRNRDRDLFGRASDQGQRAARRDMYPWIRNVGTCIEPHG